MYSSRWCVGFLVCAIVAFAQMPRSSRGVAPARGGRQPKKSAAAIPPAPRRVFVDTVAETSDGRPVIDLTAADFAVAVNGQPRKVIAAHYINTETGTITPPSTVIALTPDQIHRTLVFIADDLGISAGDAARLRSALTSFLAQQMRSSDLVSIIRTSSGSGAQQKLTGDRRELSAAIEAIRFHPMEPTAQELGAGARHTLRYVLNSLHGIGGRKGVVLLSGNATLFDKPAPGAILEAANDGSAVVSFIDLRGPGAQPTLGDSGMATIVRQTGGRLATGSDDLSGAMGGILRDQSGYYLVEYDPGDSEADIFPSRLRRWSPVLTTSRPLVELRPRQGVPDAQDFTTNTAERLLWRPSFTTPAADLRVGLVNAFSAGAIPLNFIAVYSIGKSGGQIETRVLIDARDLTYTRSLADRVTATLDVQVASFDDSGAASQGETHNYAMQWTPAEFGEMQKRGFAATISIPARAAGPYQVRIAVRDGTSGRIGSASRFLEIPDIFSGKLALSGIVITPKDREPEGLDQFEVFHPGQAFRYEYQILNLTADESKRSRVEWEARILRNGEPVYSSAPSQLDFAASDETRRRLSSGEVRLGPAMTPGFYVLELLVTDKGAKEPRAARQYARFEVK